MKCDYCGVELEEDKTVNRKCSWCHKTFCSDHWAYDKHKCEVDRATEKKIFFLREDFPIKKWKLIPYIIGGVFGILNPIFWIVMYVLHKSRDENEPLLNKKFHKRVFYWGLLIISIWIIFIASFIISSFL